MENEILKNTFRNPMMVKSNCPCRISCLLTPDAVAAVLGISIKTVHKLVREKKLACVQVTAKHRRFTEQQVEEFVRAQTVESHVDRRVSRPLSSRPKKGGKKSVGLSRADLKKEMRSWR